MPVQRCSRDGQQGWQYGDTGKCYLASEEGSDNEAKRKAYLQGTAMEGGGPLDEAKRMAELDVPTVKRGVFNGFPIADLQQMVKDTMKAMPYLIEAQESGSYRGEKNARFNNEPVPPFIHLRHYPNDIASNKMQEWAKGVVMAPYVREMAGEQWGSVRFGNVDPELAKLLSVGFPYRSAEFLPNFENPDTGEIYPVVLRSVAFLDANTEPAVPQYPGYSVKLALGELGVLTVPCEEPNQQRHEQKESTDMENTQHDTVKLSKEDIQRFEAMESRLKSLESENGILKGAVEDLKKEKDGLDQQVQKFQLSARDAEIQAYCLKLEKDFNITPAGIQAILPNLQAVDGVVKMAEGETIPAQKAYMQSIENLLKLAKEKDALFVPTVTANIPTGKQPAQAAQTLAQKKQAAIAKFSKDDKGNAVPYHKALLLASRDAETAALFNPLEQEALEKGQEGK